MAGAAQLLANYYSNNLNFFVLTQTWLRKRIRPNTYGEELALAGLLRREYCTDVCRKSRRTARKSRQCVMFN